MAASQRLLDPKILSRLSNIELAAKTVVDGFLTGLHRSPFFGFSLEFAEYRPYVPGDDPRFIDWNVFSRTDRTYIKRYLGETNTHLTILFDASASMGFDSHGVPKIEYARLLAAEDYWLDHWSPGRTVGITSISDIDGDGYRDIAYLKGGSGGATDYRLIVVSGPTPVSMGGVGLAKQESAPDDYWLNYWSWGRTVQLTAISDISGDGYDDIAYLKGGPNSASDYRLIVVTGPSPTDPGGVMLQVQETAPNDYWLNHWTPGRTVQVTAISDISGDGYDDLVYLKGGPAGPQDYRMIIVEGPSPTSPGGSGIAVHETVADDYWLDHWAARRTVRITALRQ